MADVRRILVVVAHPDDAEFGCAGSVARWVADGCAVFYCLFTSGNRGFQERVEDLLHSLQLGNDVVVAKTHKVGFDHFVDLLLDQLKISDNCRG